jgi:hypothetical protein
MLGEKGKSNCAVDHLLDATYLGFAGFILREAKYNHVLVFVREISRARPESCCLRGG